MFPYRIPMAFVHFYIITLDSELDAPTFVTSFLFQCNLFKLASSNSENNVAQCLVCKKQGQIRYCKGKSTSNYHIHMKVKIQNGV